MDPEPEILIFPTRPIPFNLIDVSLDSSRCQVDWSVRTDLPKQLQCQVRNNMIDLVQFMAECDQEDVPIATFDQNIDRIRYYLPPGPEKDQRCQQFKDRLRAYIDVGLIDQDVFANLDWEVETWAIVLLYQGEYYGHIYSWRSLVDPDRSFAMGIRSRVDRVFLEDSLKNITAYLLEGARRLSQSQGSTTLTVTYPFQHVIQILRQLGFELDDDVDTEFFGNSIVTRTSKRSALGGWYCSNCFSYQVARGPFATNLQVVLIQ